MASLADLLKHIKETGETLSKGYPRARGFADALVSNISKNVPSQADFQSPQAMSEWSQAAALNAPMGLTLKNLNAGLIQKYLQEGKLSPEEMAQYEANAVKMTEQGLQKYNVLNANVQGGTPESRAIDLGFYTGNKFTSEMPKRDFNRSAEDKLETFYHGGPDPFDMSGFKEASGVSFNNPNNISGGYAFLTSSKGEAKGYADELAQKKGIKTKVHEFYVRPEGKTKLISTSTGNYLPNYKQLKEDDYGQTLVDFGKYGKGNDDTYYRHEWLLPYSPEQIRSIKAAFDPLRKASPSLLASTAGAFTLADLLNQDRNR